MAELLLNLVVLWFFAWFAKILLGARDLSWGRTMLAALAGLSVGSFIALALLVSDFSQVQDVDEAAFRSLAIPFQIVITMAAIVVLELVRPSRTGTRRLRVMRPWQAFRRWAGTVRRGWQVTRIVVSNGLAPLLGLRRGEVSARSPEELARRVRTALEEAGGMVVKLGQLLATRPDLLPPEVMQELGRLHASVKPLDRQTVETVIEEETGRSIDDLFASFDWRPLGSASIAQAHTARLKDGRQVVVKVRRPGLEDLVERDLRIAFWLGRIAERRTTWGRNYGVVDLLSEFAGVLRNELDFTIEARQADEIRESLRKFPNVTAPSIVDELTTKRMLVMQRLSGTPLALASSPVSPESMRENADALCRSQITAMLEGNGFHGDPHPGNVLLLEDGNLGLIDFGITDRLGAFEQASVFQMLLALKLEHPTLLFEAMISIGAVDAGHDPDKIERSFARFMSVHLGSGLPSPEALTDLLRLTTELKLRIPSSTSTMFRALATLAGTLEQLSPGYPLIDVVADIGGGELTQRFAPDSMSQYVKQEWAGLAPLLSRAPRHLDRMASILEQGRFTTRVRVFDQADELRGLERLVNRGLLAILSIGTGAVSVMMLGTEVEPTLAGTDIRLIEVWGWAGLLVAVILLLRVLLDILRSGEPTSSPR